MIHVSHTIFRLGGCNDRLDAFQVVDFESANGITALLGAVKQVVDTRGISLSQHTDDICYRFRPAHIAGKDHIGHARQAAFRS